MDPKPYPNNIKNINFCLNVCLDQRANDWTIVFINLNIGIKYYLLIKKKKHEYK